MTNPSPQSQESLPALLRSIADQAQTFVKAEIELVKLESKHTVIRASVALMVVTGSALLLAIALSLVAAAVVVVSGGSAGAALLTAAGVDLIVAVVSSVLVLKWARKPVETVAAEATQISNLPQHGESLS